MRIMTTATSDLPPRRPPTTPAPSNHKPQTLHKHINPHTHVPNPAINVESSISTADTQPPPSAAFEA